MTPWQSRSSMSWKMNLQDAKQLGRWANFSNFTRLLKQLSDPFKVSCLFTMSVITWSDCSLVDDGFGGREVPLAIIGDIHRRLTGAFLRSHQMLGLQELHHLRVRELASLQLFHQCLEIKNLQGAMQRLVKSKSRPEGGRVQLRFAKPCG